MFIFLYCSYKKSYNFLKKILRNKDKDNMTKNNGALFNS